MTILFPQSPLFVLENRRLNPDFCTMKKAAHSQYSKPSSNTKAMRMTKTVFRIIFISILFLGACSQAHLNAQGWRWSFYESAGGPFQDDGTYITSIADYAGDTSFFVFNSPAPTAGYGFFHTSYRTLYTTHPWLSQIDDNHHFSRDVVRVSRDTAAVLEELLPENGGDRMVNIILYNINDTNSQGQNSPTMIWNKRIFDMPNVDGFAKSLQMDGNGEYFVLAEREETLSNTDTLDIMAFKLTHEGDIIWSLVFGQPGYDKAIAAAPSSSIAGAYLVLGTIAPSSDTSLRHSILYLIDENGVVVSETNINPSGSEEAYDMIALSDGNLLMCGVDKNNNLMFFRKLDEDGNELWRRDYPMVGRSAITYELVEDPSGELVATGSITDSTDMETDGLLLKMDANGLPLWERNVGIEDEPDVFKRITLYPDGGYLLGGFRIRFDLPHAYMARTDVNGVIKAGLIKGNVQHDLDLNCAHSTGDVPLEDWIVQAYLDSLHIFYGDTDSLGNYWIECDTGDYVVSLIPPVSYWSVCTNDVPISISYLDTADVDFSVQTAIECPYLTIDHFTSPIRPCDTTTVYVNYCNKGTEEADSAYLEMTLDSILTFLDSDIAPTSINGNLVTFPLGDIGIGECGDFTFRVTVDCNATIWQTACLEAHIFPDSICEATNPLWSGAFITVEGECNGDTVYFQLHNIGNENMANPLEYIVIEDAVLLMKNTYELNSSESVTIPIAATGATYHLIAQQEPNAPGNSIPVAIIELCIGSSGNPPSMGYFTQFSQYDLDAFISSYCRQVTNSFDPNDKQALPAGFGTSHNIFVDTDLEYLIRFQNTGTDTAFRVTLVDTLSLFLDPATVRPGASSHPYEFELDGNGVLRFTFPGIQLPHEAVDEEGSQGFVSFRIAQRPNNPIGSVIENAAEIYFDFNLPIVTNTTWHTVHEPWIEIIKDSVYTGGGHIDFGELLVYPNPAMDVVNFELPKNIHGEAIFSLYNQMGRMVQKESFNHNRIQFQRGSLSAGIYFYTIKINRARAYSGKVILK